MAENFYEMYLEEMELIRPLDQEEEKRVLAAAARADKEAGNRLVEGNLARALAVAKEYEGKELPISDLVQEANMALMMAVTEYDGSQEWPDFAETKIRQAVEAALLEQRSEAEIEETMAARVNVLQTVSQVMAKELGREATVEELALDALTVNGEGTAASDGEAEEETEPAPALRRDGYGRSGRPSLGYDPMRDGWDLNS